MLKARIIIPKWKKDPKIANSAEVSENRKAEYPKYNLTSPNQDSTKYLYQRRLDEYLLEPSESFVETYDIIDSIHKAANEALGKKEARLSKRVWWTKVIEDLVKLKKQESLKWLSTKNPNDKIEYDDIKREVRRTVNYRKNESWDKKCKEIDTYIGGR